MADKGQNCGLRPAWDDRIGQSYVGKYILVGITYLDHEGNETQKQQLHGIIESASESQGIRIQLKGVYEGESWVMPPDQRAIHKGSTGTYKLHMSNETIENPDFLSTWTFQAPKPDDKDT